MDEPKAKSQLEFVTNIAVVLVSVAVVFAFAGKLFERSGQPDLQSGLQRGQKLARAPTDISNGKSGTLLIILNTNCHFCRENVPLYNQLTEVQQKAESPVAIVAVFPNTEEEVRDYAQRENLKVSTITRTEFKSFGTPTLILIDSNWNIRDFWLGKLSKDEEEQVIRAVVADKS